jgi:transcriptional regulator with XRE-family HTH domain
MPALISGQVLRAARQAKGWNQQALARQAGIDKSVISRLEREIQDDLKVSVLIALATALDLSVERLLKGPDRPPGALIPLLAAQIDRVAALPDAQIDRVAALPDAPQRQIAAIIQGYLSVETTEG